MAAHSESECLTRNVTGSKPGIIGKLIGKLPLGLEIDSICKFDNEMAFEDKM